MKKIIHKTRTKIINGSRIKRRHKRPKVHYVGTIDFIVSSPRTLTISDTEQHTFDPVVVTMYDPNTPNPAVEYVISVMDATTAPQGVAIPGTTIQLVCTGNANLWIAANYPNLLGIVDVVDITQYFAVRLEVSSVLASCTSADTFTVAVSYNDVTVVGHGTVGDGAPATIFTYTGSWSVTTNLDITV